MNNIGKKFIAPLSWDSHRPDLQPNGEIVECIEDKGNGYLVVTTEKDSWLTNIKNLIEVYE